jgi:hypothetical protein
MTSIKILIIKEGVSNNTKSMPQIPLIIFNFDLNIFSVEK